MEDINLYEEIINELESNNKKIEDIKFITINIEKDYFKKANIVKIDINNFLEVAKNTNYNDGYGAVTIPLSLIIAGDNWWLERAEYDGSEWFEFKTYPYEPKETIKINKINLY